MDNDQRENQQGDVIPVDDSSYSDQAIEFSALIRERAFIGEVPYATISDGIQKQFEDYINMEDTTNYVDIFYNQLSLSYDRVEEDESEPHPTEIKEILSSVHDAFIGLMQELFYRRLTISIADLESETSDKEDLEFIFRRLYEYFILGAKNNFKVVIASDVLKTIGEIGSEEEFYARLQELMDDYSPLLTTITPTRFLECRGDQEVYDLFDNGRVNGNFLRKYSPKFYRNEDFVVEMINYIMMVHRFNDNKTFMHDESSNYYEDDEAFTEMATVAVDHETKLRIQVNPTRERIGNPYFKVFDSCRPKEKETRVARLHFLDSGMEFHKDGFLNWDITNKDLKRIISSLESSHKDFPRYSVWQMACYLWNMELGIVDDRHEYFNGQYDTENKEHPSYVPSYQKMPSKWVYDKFK